MTDRDQFDEREFEARLSREMTRAAAPEGFADRVMDRVAASAATRERGGRLAVVPRRSAWMTIAATLLLGLLLGGWQWKERQLRREREQAARIQQQFDLAMQVTQRTLAGVRSRIGHAGETHPAGMHTTGVHSGKEVEQ